MKRIALVVAVAAMAGCMKGEQKPATADTSKMMMMSDTSKMMMMSDSQHMMMADTSMKMMAPAKKK